VAVKRKDIERWEEFKADYPCMVNVRRTDHIGFLNVAVLSNGVNIQRDKYYEKRDSWLANYVFGTSGEY